MTTLIKLGGNNKEVNYIEVRKQEENTDTVLEERVRKLSITVGNILKVLNMLNDQHKATTNLDGIPVGISLIAYDNNSKLIILTVKEDGYYINDLRFQSLSAAAEYITGKRRSGWDFWRTIDGRPIKEKYKVDQDE